MIGAYLGYDFTKILYIVSLIIFVYYSIYLFILNKMKNGYLNKIKVNK